MIELEKALEYNRELKEGLGEMFSMLPPGQQRQAFRNEKVKACLFRFHIIEEKGEET